MGNFFTDNISKDPRLTSTKRIADRALLEPVTADAVRAIIADANDLGIELMVFETFRSQAADAAVRAEGDAAEDRRRPPLRIGVRPREEDR